MRSKQRARSAALLLVGLTALGLACRSREGAATKPNILVIVIDTARQDALSLYGYERETTPNLSRLAARAATFENAYSTSSWTAPAHASLFTGLYPAAHHCTQEAWQLDQGATTLAEMLAAAGYRTIGLVENPFLTRQNGFDQGFEIYEEIWKKAQGEACQNGDVVHTALDGFLRERDTQQPFFAFVNLIGPHSPYNSSGEFRQRFVTDPTQRISDNGWASYYFAGRRYRPAEWTHLRQLYDAEILAADRSVGRLVALLEGAGILEDTIVVVTSDHGENLGEHGHVDHLFSLYETTIRVPLVVRYPEVFEPGSRPRHPVQLTDIVPTLLALADPEHEPAGEIQGRDLADDDDRIVFAEYYRPNQVREALQGNPARAVEAGLRPFDRRLRVLRRDGLKLIWGEDGQHELYDLVRDPEESTNVFEAPGYRDRRRELLELLESTLAQFERAAPTTSPQAPDEPDPDTADALRSLGYLQ